MSDTMLARPAVRWFWLFLLWPLWFKRLSL